MKANRVMVLPVVAMMVGALAVAGCSNDSEAAASNESAAVQVSDGAQGEAQATAAVGTEDYARFGRGGRAWGRGERGERRGWGRGWGFGRREGRGDRRHGWWRFW